MGMKNRDISITRTGQAKLLAYNMRGSCGSRKWALLTAKEERIIGVFM
jgi:hypothetical protein